MLVRHRTHYASHSKTVKIIVDKDHHAQRHSGKLRAHPGLDLCAGPAAKRGRSSRLVHHAHHDAQDHQEYDDTHVVSICEHSHDSVLEYMDDGPFKAESGVKDSSDQDPDKQGTVNLLGDQRKTDGYHRRHQRPEGSVHVRHVLCCFVRRQHRHGAAKQNQQKGGDPPDCLFLSSHVLFPLFFPYNKKP